MGLLLVLLLSAGFLSTPSARRATWSYEQALADYDISIHALREEGDLPTSTSTRNPSRFLSTPSARRATHALVLVALGNQFLSTPSARRATQPRRRFRHRRLISIHALREEGDTSADGSLSLIKRFLSTPSARRATAAQGARRLRFAISIHALREEGDPYMPEVFHDVMKFLSTPSARRATSCRAFFMTATTNFYPRPPRGGRPRTPTAIT